MGAIRAVCFFTADAKAKTVARSRLPSASTLPLRSRPFASRGLEMAEIFYSGEQAGQVTVREGETKRLLDPRFDLCKHSPPGFA